MLATALTLHVEQSARCCGTPPQHWNIVARSRSPFVLHHVGARVAPFFFTHALLLHAYGCTCIERETCSMPYHPKERKRSRNTFFWPFNKVTAVKCHKHGNKMLQDFPLIGSSSNHNEDFLQWEVHNCLYYSLPPLLQQTKSKKQKWD